MGAINLRAAISAERAGLRLAQAPAACRHAQACAVCISSAAYRPGFESARPHLLAMWRCRGTVQSPHPDLPYEEQRPAILNWDSNTVLVHPCQILAGMTRVRLRESAVPGEVSSNRRRRPGIRLPKRFPRFGAITIRKSASRGGSQTHREVCHVQSIRPEGCIPPWPPIS